MIYSDPFLNISLSSSPCTLGHMVVKPNKLIKSIEELSDFEIQYLFFASSYSATSLFETLGAHGTNILLSESEKNNLNIQIVARKENDRLNLQWTPIAMNDVELNDLAKQIRDEVDRLVWEEQHVNDKKKEVVKEVSEIKKDENNNKVNYLLKSVNRNP